MKITHMSSVMFICPLACIAGWISIKFGMIIPLEATYFLLDTVGYNIMENASTRGVAATLARL
jgi:hypothetical protein